MSFPPGHHITKEAGAKLATWARGDSIEGPDKEAWDHARRIAQEGVEAITTYFQKVADDDTKQRLQPIRQELWDAAKRADANRTGLG